MSWMYLSYVLESPFLWPATDSDDCSHGWVFVKHDRKSGSVSASNVSGLRSRTVALREQTRSDRNEAYAVLRRGPLPARSRPPPITL